MKIFWILVISLLPLSVIIGQGQTPESIVAEGKKLYRSEMASWYGTDIFMARYADQRNSLGGYFSYADGANYKAIFFTQGEKPKVLATISFDSTYNVNTAMVDGKQRDLTTHESNIFVIWRKALVLINTDTSFKQYKSTNFNLIPFIDGGDKKVYILSGTALNNVVFFGNDYLITFDKDNNIASSRSLHRNLIPVEYGKTDDAVIGAIHSHSPETGDYITATDICTLMLYEKLTKWKQHIVVSQNYVSIWNCETDSLITLPRSEWEKMGNQKKD